MSPEARAVRRRRPALVVLAGLLATACASTSCPAPEPFTIDALLTADQLDEIVTRYGLPNRDAIACETACSFAYAKTGARMEVVSIESCNFTAPASPSGEGLVSCRGTADEGFCE